MHPAAHRALRELIATGTLVTQRWDRLADRLSDTASILREGAREADAMTEAMAALGVTREVAIDGTATGRLSR